MEVEMKRAIAILVLVTSCAVARAEGPATGPSAQTGCAPVPSKDLKPDSGKNVTNLSKNELLKTRRPDCKQKQEKAEHPGR